LNGVKLEGNKIPLQTVEMCQVKVKMGKPENVFSETSGINIKSEKH